MGTKDGSSPTTAEAMGGKSQKKKNIKRVQRAKGGGHKGNNSKGRGGPECCALRLLVRNFRRTNRFEKLKNDNKRR